MHGLFEGISAYAEPSRPCHFVAGGCEFLHAQISFYGGFDWCGFRLQCCWISAQILFEISAFICVDFGFEFLNPLPVVITIIPGSPGFIL